MSAVEVDLEAGTVEGIGDAVAAVVEKFPEFKVPKPNDDKKEPPGVDDGAPGGNRGDSIDVNALKPGDVMKMSDAQLSQLLTEGIRFREPSTIPGEPDRVIEFRHGGNETAQRIRQYFGGNSKLLDPGFHGAEVAKEK
jgi:hypothetical protein